MTYNGAVAQWTERMPSKHHMVVRFHSAPHYEVVADVTSKTLHAAIRETVDESSRIMTDDMKSYHYIGLFFKGGHESVNHAKREYVRGDAYTNTAESYFALLKRGLNGTFHHVSKKHLARYCDEFDFRWNSRKSTDEERMIKALGQIEGKKLRYRDAA